MSFSIVGNLVLYTIVYPPLTWSCSFPPHHLRIIVNTENEAALKDLWVMFEAFPELVPSDPVVGEIDNFFFEMQ